MSNLIDSIIKTRTLAGNIFVNSLTNLDGLSELGIKEKIASEIQNHNEIFPEGWYNPPPAGISVILDQKPFKRLQYDNLRQPVFWPRADLIFEKETVAMVYCSPIDRKTGMLADIGLTIYRGENGAIKQHIKNSYQAILAIAKHAEVGMKFSGLCAFASNSFENKFRTTRWTTKSSPNTNMNLGHTIPGSFENNFIFGETYEEIKEAIRTKRIQVNEVENFQIPETCAFTIESRLEDANDPNMPSSYFHFIVCFDKGKKTILENYSQIFSTVGMDYMNSK